MKFVAAELIALDRSGVKLIALDRRLQRSEVVLIAAKRLRGEAL